MSQRRGSPVEMTISERILTMQPMEDHMPENVYPEGALWRGPTLEQVKLRKKE